MAVLFNAPYAKYCFIFRVWVIYSFGTGKVPDC